LIFIQKIIYQYWPISSEKSFGKSTSSYNIKGIGSPHNPPTAGSRRFLARVERSQAGKTGLRV